MKIIFLCVVFLFVVFVLLVSVLVFVDDIVFLVVIWFFVVSGLGGDDCFSDVFVEWVYIFVDVVVGVGVVEMVYFVEDVECFGKVIGKSSKDEVLVVFLILVSKIGL